MATRLEDCGFPVQKTPYIVKKQENGPKHTMQIVYHIGANCTDGERLVKSLLKNAKALEEHGIRIPGPASYRRLVREAIQDLNGSGPAGDVGETILETILGTTKGNRLVMSNGAFLCVPPRVFQDGIFYPQAEPKLQALQRLFPDAEIDIHLAIRNPATFIPAVFAQVKRGSYEQFMGGLAPSDIRWSDLIARMQAAAPEINLTVWCNEDTPLIWAQIIREMAGIDPLMRITGGFDLLGSIMSPEGMNRFLSYIKTHPPQTEIQKRRIIAAFLDKFAIDAEMVEDVALPGWTDDLVHDLTEGYEEDIFRIEKMSGVNFIAP